MFPGLALVAGAVDAALGYPDLLYRAIGHPVTWIGRLIAWGDKQWNSDAEVGWRHRTRGALLMGALVLLCLLVGLLLTRLLHLLLPWWLALIATAVLASSLIAQRSLYDHVAAVASALGKSVEAGRDAVAMIVGRDTKELDEAGICRAAIESLAESLCDGVVAPLLWIVVAGLPGGIAYKAINTADSMIGHKTPLYIDFGWAAARSDDVANWPAARLAALWLALGAMFVPGASPWRALAVAWRDAGKHASPNAGWPEAAMAGALGLRLMGPRSYEGERVAGQWMGDGRFALKAADIRTALKLYRAACGVQLAVMAVLFGVTFFL